MTLLEQQQTKSRNTLHDASVSNIEIFPQSEQTTSLKQNKEIDITQTTNAYHSFQKTYSQVVTGSDNPRPAQHSDLIWLIKTWVSSTRQAISNSKTELFNKELWNRDKIYNAFFSLSELKKLLQHKLHTKPTQEYIPSGIRTKLFY